MNKTPTREKLTFELRYSDGRIERFTYREYLKHCMEITKSVVALSDLADDVANAPQTQACDRN